MSGITEALTVKYSWDLPEGWEWIPLGSPNVAEIIMGQSPSSKTYNSIGQGLPFFQGKAEFGDLYPNPVKWCTSPKKIAFSGDVLISVRAPVGPTNLVREECCIGRGLAAIRPKENILTRYLLYALRSRESELSTHGRGSTFASIGKEELSAFRIPVPFPSTPNLSLDIQQRIVTRLELLLGELKGDRKLLEEMRHDADKFLAASLDEVLKKLESVTEIVPLGEIATAFNGRASGQGSSLVRVFKTRHVYPHYLRLDNPSYMQEEQVQKLPEDRYLQSDDVLMANIAEGTLGRVAYVHECEDSWTVDTQIMILRSKDENVLHGKWLYYYLWSERGQNEILSRRSGIAFADKRGQTHIYPKNVVEIPVPKPPIQQQRQAATYLDSILFEVEAMQGIFEQDAKLFERLEQSILEKAFRGQL